MYFIWKKSAMKVNYSLSFTQIDPVLLTNRAREIPNTHREIVDITGSCPFDPWEVKGALQSLGWNVGPLWDDSHEWNTSIVANDSC